MANRWERVQTVLDFIVWSSRITADGDCSHEIKRCLLLARKIMTNLYSILKSRDITLSTKVPLVKAMVFSSSDVWMWDLDYKENWVPTKWCFWTVVLEKILRVPWIARRSKQCILKEISPGYSLEVLLLKWNSNTVATWCEELTHWKRPRCWERLRAGREGANRGWDSWMASLTQWTWVGWTLGVGDGQGGLACCGSRGRKELDTTVWLNWTRLSNFLLYKYLYKSTLNTHWRDWCWSWSSNTLVTWWEELTHWKRPWCWEILRAGGVGGDTGWDVWWHHWLNGQEFEQTPGDNEGQWRLACCTLWGHKDLDTTEQLNDNNSYYCFSI